MAIICVVFCVYHFHRLELPLKDTLLEFLEPVDTSLTHYLFKLLKKTLRDEEPLPRTSRTV